MTLKGFLRVKFIVVFCVVKCIISRPQRRAFDIDALQLLKITAYKRYYTANFKV